MVFRNKLKEILDRGEVAFGLGSFLPSEALVEIMGWAGFDFVGFDLEHGLLDMQTVGRLFRVVDGMGLTPLVRVSKNEEIQILNVLDLGAKAIIVPHISTKEDAIKAVRACKYGSGGTRGACPLIRANRYGLGNWAEYQEAANENIPFIALVEDELGVKNIEDIISVDGVDAVFMGTFDFSVSAGLKGDVGHSKVKQAQDKVLSACKDRGIPTFHAPCDISEIPTWIDKGARIFSMGVDNIMFAKLCESLVKSAAPFRNKKYPL